MRWPHCTLRSAASKLPKARARLRHPCASFSQPAPRSCGPDPRPLRSRPPPGEIRFLCTVDWICWGNLPISLLLRLNFPASRMAIRERIFCSCLRYLGFFHGKPKVCKTKQVGFLGWGVGITGAAHSQKKTWYVQGLSVETMILAFPNRNGASVAGTLPTGSPAELQMI